MMLKHTHITILVAPSKESSCEVLRITTVVRLEYVIRPEDVDFYFLETAFKQSLVKENSKFMNRQIVTT